MTPATLAINLQLLANNAKKGSTFSMLSFREACWTNREAIIAALKETSCGS